MFIASYILSKRYTRYGGDCTNTLSLLIGSDDTAYLCLTGGTDNVLVPITSLKSYTDWLVDNHFDLLESSIDNDFNQIYNEWFNDRDVPNGRWDEFRSLLRRLNPNS